MKRAVVYQYTLAKVLYDERAWVTEAPVCQVEEREARTIRDGNRAEAAELYGNGGRKW